MIKHIIQINVQCDNEAIRDAMTHFIGVAISKGLPPMSVKIDTSRPENTAIDPDPEEAEALEDNGLSFGEMKCVINTKGYGLEWEENIGFMRSLETLTESYRTRVDDLEKVQKKYDALLKLFISNMEFFLMESFKGETENA